VSAPTFGAGVNFKGKRVDFMRISLARPVTAAATLAALALPALALDGPPVAPVRPVTNTYWGQAVGGALTQRPDLFAAIIDNVGASDTLRIELSPNGPPNVPEFGTVTTEEGFKGLYAMSAYHHVRDSVRYPGVLLTTGIHDPRVDSWQMAKMTARLQAASTSGKPILLRVDYDAGHGIGSTKSQGIDEMADEWSFLLWQFGDKAFQPK